MAVIDVEGWTIVVEEIAAITAGGCAIILRSGREVSFRFNHAKELRDAMAIAGAAR